MKKTILSLMSLTLVSLSARAAQPMQVCMEMQRTGQTNNALSCQSQIRNGHFDSVATDMCLVLVKQGQTNASLSCLSKIKDKAFPTGLDLCRSILDQGMSNSAMSCVDQSAVPYVPAPPAPGPVGPACGVYGLEQRIDGALHELNQGNLRDAQEILKAIKRELMAR